MMRNRVSKLRLLVGGFAVLLLLTPSLVTAIVWTTVNFYISALTIGLTIAVALTLPKSKWLFAAIAAASIALPPYPNWLFWNEKDGWYIWVGPSLRNLEIGANIVFFAIALIPFIGLFWAINKEVKK